MGGPYSQDLRERAVAAVEGGMSRRQAARMLKLGITTPPSKSGLTWPRRGHDGRPNKPRSTLKSSSSLMRREPRPTWRGIMGAPSAARE